MDHVEAPLAPDFPREAEHVPQRRAVLAGIGQRTRMRLGRFGVAVDMDALDLFIGFVPAAPGGADHADLIAMLGQRSGFEPDAPVKRDRQVFDHDEDAAGKRSIGHSGLGMRIFAA